MWHIHPVEYYSVTKKSKIMSFAAAWLQLEIYHTKWSKKDKRQTLYDITYKWTLKYDTNEPIYETETDWA